jgi:hypothetical protein
MVWRAKFEIRNTGLVEPEDFKYQRAITDGFFSG